MPGGRWLPFGIASKQPRDQSRLAQLSRQKCLLYILTLLMVCDSKHQHEDYSFRFQPESAPRRHYRLNISLTELTTTSVVL